MGRLRATSRIGTAIVVMTAVWVCGVTTGAVGAEESSASSSPQSSAGTSGTVARTLSAREPGLRLTRMEHVGSRAAEELIPGGSVSDRGQLALSLAANDFLERLSQTGGRQRGVFRTLRAAARIADTPNRALCMLTGADRARLDLLKRRVSLTWFVSW